MLDLRGLKCPLPALRTRKALRRLVTGGTIVVLCTDPLAAIDIPHLLREEGDRLDGQSEVDGVLRFEITRTGPVSAGDGGARPASVARSAP